MLTCGHTLQPNYVVLCVLPLTGSVELFVVYAASIPVEQASVHNEFRVEPPIEDTHYLGHNTKNLYI